MPRERQYMTPAEATAAELFPRSILRREFRIKPAKGATPAGDVWQGQGTYSVFAKADCVPMRPARALTPAQLAALAAGRQLAGTVRCSQCGQRFDKMEMGTMWRDKVIRTDTCEYCIYNERLTTASANATEWLAADPLFLDTETTGLDYTDQVAEIAILDAAGNVLFQSLIRPSVPMGDGAAAVHGITDAELSTAPTWPTVHAQVAALLSGRIVICHNSDFDRRMLRQTITAHGLADIDATFRCTMHALTPANGGKWPRLSVAANLAGATFPDGSAHRAAYDAEVCRRIVVALASQPNRVI